MLAHYTFTRDFGLCLVFPECTRWLPDLSGRKVHVAALRPFACWDCGFESHRGHVCLFLVVVLSRRIEVSASG